MQGMHGELEHRVRESLQLACKPIFSACVSSVKSQHSSFHPENQKHFSSNAAELMEKFRS